MRPSGQAFPTNSAACIPPGGQSPWIEIPAASLGNACANRLTLTYPGNLPQVDVPVTLVLASRPDEAAVAARRSFDIGPSQPTVTLLVHRWLKDAAARTFTELADETQRLARERLVKPVYGKRPEKFPCLTTLAIDRTIYPKVWFRPWTLANVIRQLDAHYPAYLAKPLYTINMTSDAFMNTGSMTAHGVDLLHSIRLAGRAHRPVPRPAARADPRRDSGRGGCGRWRAGEVQGAVHRRTEHHVGRRRGDRRLGARRRHVDRHGRGRQPRRV